MLFLTEKKNVLRKKKLEKLKLLVIFPNNIDLYQCKSAILSKIYLPVIIG